MFQEGESPGSFSGGVLYRQQDPADRQTYQLFTRADSLVEGNGGDPVPDPEPVLALVPGLAGGGGGATPHPLQLAGATNVAQKWVQN